MPEQNKLGPYFAFDGLPKSGKSTQLRLLVPILELAYPDRKIVVTREPGGTPLADAIRGLAMGFMYTPEMTDVCEAYLYAASRAHTLRVIVRPAQKMGAIVICDRSYFSSIAIQGAARGLGESVVRYINQEAVGSIRPHRVIYLDEAPEVCVMRAAENRDMGDKFEAMKVEFFEKIRQGYFMASLQPENRFETINTTGKSIEEIHGVIVVSVLRFLEEYFT